MLLCLDVGNTHILWGVFKQGHLVARFRAATDLIGSSDQFGIFLLTMFQANSLSLTDVSATVLCSVVPSYDYTLRHAVNTYVKTPLFVLQAGVKTGLNIKYKNPNEVGADKIANAIGAVHAFPNKNIIIVDTSTATTVCAISKKRDYLGGAILPGMKLSMESLKSNTAKLMEVDIVKPPVIVGRTTRESIQSGLYYGHLGALKEIIAGYKQEVFANEPVTVIGTGGFCHLYKDEKLFDIILPDLVLQGLYQAFEYSKGDAK